ncbi:MAG TPA: hypothetical protein VLX90_21610 [Steroidobacteraceae bacterium]|nr:hypothetical protein [Steroidobacteraceae bacterium]
MASKNGESGVGSDGEQVKEHLRAARDAAASAARSRARQAQEWARVQIGELQERLEAQPYRASAWALGAGFLAGILIMSLVHNRRR